jgi:probable phosphoglycerate mutase
VRRERARAFLVRHGRTHWNVEGRAQGHVDVELDELGRAQTASAIERLAREPLALVLSSDLCRARALAEPLAERLGAPLELAAEIRERSYGAWEGQLFADLRAREDEEVARGHTRVERRPPDGESISDVFERVAKVEARVRDELGRARSLAVIAHGGSLSCLLARLLFSGPDAARLERGPRERYREACQRLENEHFRLGNASVTELALRGDGHVVLLTYADTGHLAPRP